MSSQQVRRILIVEDEKTLSHFLAQCFLKEPEDYEVVTAASAEEAIEQLAGRPFGAIITDIVLPGMSGLDLLERVRAAQPGARVIITSAYGTDELRERAGALGAFEYIDKPFAFSGIKRVVLRAFEAASPEAPPTPQLQKQPQGGGACTP